MILKPTTTPEKYRGAIYMDMELYLGIESLRQELGFRSWNDAAVKLLEAALQQTKK